MATEWRERFEALCDRKQRAAQAAVVRPLRTDCDAGATGGLVRIESDWSRRWFDGPFYASAPAGELPAIHAVFVESRTGNTAAANPASLGGGDTDLHLIYEGLSRVFADGVMAGAGTIGPNTFFSVWHPEMAALRHSLGVPRHPAQIVLSLNCTMDPDRYVLFNVPDVRVFVLTNASGRRRLEPRIADRPWVTILDAEGADALADQARRLRRAGIRHVSAVGGRHASTALVDAGLVSDLYLTTTAVDAGASGTPWYVGQSMPVMTPIVRKHWDGDAGSNRFAHLRLNGSSR